MNPLLDTPSSSPFPYLETAQLFLFLEFIFEFYIELRQLRSLRIKTIPKEVFRFENIWKVTQEDVNKNKDYGYEKKFFHMLRIFYNMNITLFKLYYSYYPILMSYSKHFAEQIGFKDNIFVGCIIFLSIESLIGIQTELPFDYYFTFVIEEKWGFNKTTYEVFVKDYIKNFQISVPLVSLALCGLIKIILWAGEKQFYWYCTLFLFVFFIFVQLLFPNFIGPCFYKFTNLGENTDEELKERELSLLEDIKVVANEVKFPMGKVYVIDGSTRTAHSNAFFFGICGKKMVVLFDTLLIKDKEDESKWAFENSDISGIQCHEFGHWYHKHNLVNMAISFSVMFTVLQLSQFFLFNKEMYLSFGCEDVDHLLGFFLFLPFLAPVMQIYGIMMSYITREMEYMADRFAIRFGRQKGQVNALVKMNRKSNADLDPDWLYVMLNFSHPTLLDRIKQIDDLMADKKVK